MTRLRRVLCRLVRRHSGPAVRVIDEGRYNPDPAYAFAGETSYRFTVVRQHYECGRCRTTIEQPR